MKQNMKVPEGWKKVKLDDIYEIKQGKHLSLKELLDKGYSVYGANGKVGYYNSYMYENPTLLITCRGATCGSINVTEPKSWVTGNSIALLPKEELDINFMRYLLRYTSFKDVISGSAQPQIIATTLRKKKVKLPDLKTQKKIVEVLEKAEKAIEKRKQANRLLDEYLKSLFMEMFENENYEIKIINDIVKNIEAGWSVGGEERQLDKDEVGVLKISAVTKGTFDASQYKVIDKNIEIKKYLSCKKGDILFSRANTRELVGASCIVNKDYDNLILPDKLWKITIDENIVSKEFFLFLINTQKVRKQISKVSTGTSGSMLNISMKKFRNIKINIPDVKKQKHFSEIYVKIQSIKQKNLSELQKMNNLFNSLMQKAFKGELEFK